MIKLKGYIFSRKINNSSIPQNVQNIVLREYCKRNNFFFILSDSEYSLKNSFHVLEGILQSTNTYDGILFYSIYQLPLDNEKRKKILIKLLTNKKQIHFAQENYQINNKYQINKIDNILKVNINLPKNIDYKYLRNYLSIKN